MKETRGRYKHLLNFIANIVTLVMEGIAFSYVWYQIYEPTLWFPFYRRGNWAVIGMYVLCMFLFTKSMNGYKIGYLRMIDIWLAHFLSIVMGTVVAYFEICIIQRDYIDPRGLLMMTLFEVCFMTPWVFAVRKLYGYLYPPRDMLVVYGKYSPEDFIAKINTRKDKYNVCATISYEKGMEVLKKEALRYEGVVLCDVPSPQRNQIMKYCYEQGIRTYVTPKISDILLRSSDNIHLFDTPLYLLRNQGLTITQSIGKRAMDIVISLIGCVLAAPFMLIIAIAIKLYDGGPILYAQERLTKDGKPFMVYKFRSMIVDSEKKGARLAAKGDDRVTPVGKIIRNIHFDELPQLFNILKGDMSVVGPRPERRIIADEYKEEIPEFDYRLKVKAGLTGYAQVYGRYNTTPYDKLKMDVTYIENYTIWLDIKILFLTFKILFQKENTEGIEKEQTTAMKNR